MGYAQFLKPRRGVLTDEGIEGIIDLAKIRDPKRLSLEARPDDFFDLSYPTSDVIKVIEEIHRRFTTPRKSSGLFLFEGLKGSGKSHILLLVYNLLAHKDMAHKWLSENGLVCEVPQDVIVILNKFTDDPYGAIWNLIFEKLGAPPYEGTTHPKIEILEKALGERRLVLIFDELEQGIKVIRDQALQAQNIAFLQALSEYGNRSDQVTMFASVYTDKVEPGNTLKRISPRCTIQFENARDRSRIILHRLFENHKGFDHKPIIPVIESYLQLWNRHIDGLNLEELKREFLDSYPFSPSLMKLVLRRIPARGGFQNVRGAIALLSNLVRLTHLTNDIITPSAVILEDRANTIMLKDLDPSGDLIGFARDNMDELKGRLPLVKEMTAAVLLYTLSDTGGSRGVSRDDLMMDLLTPSADINDVEITLAGLQRYGSHFWHQEGRYYFDPEENPEAKVEIRGLRYSDEEAYEKLTTILIAELFRETMNTAVYSSLEQIQKFLKDSDKSRPRYILTGRRLIQEERHKIYHGAEIRNLILVLEPKDDKLQIATDKDLLKWAKRILAAEDLIPSAPKVQRKEAYARIAREDLGHITERIRKAGLVYVRWEVYGQSISEDQVELEPMPGDWSKDKVHEKLNQDCFPMLIFKEHLEKRLHQIKGQAVRDIDNEYRNTLGFPVPLTVGVVAKALRALCKDGQIGIQHSSGNFCCENPDLTETEFSQAKVTDPFEKGPEKPKCPRCKAWPCQCPHTTPIVCNKCGQSPCICLPSPAPECSVCGRHPCICPKKRIERLKIPAQTSASGLRQETAIRLQAYPDAEIIKVSYKVFLEKANLGDLSTLPPAFRGALTGAGEVVVEISLSKTGRFSKTQIEQQIESLPNITDATYSLEMDMEIQKS